APPFPLPARILGFDFGSQGAEITLVALHESQLESTTCYPEELSLLHRNTVNKRRLEFALGRAAAHLALRAAGDDTSSPVLQNKDRDPAWPSGFVGSITHCGPWAMAAAAKAKSLESIGIDLEDTEAVPFEEIAELVSTDAERDWLLQSGNSKLKLAGLFSAKEAAYKALFPLCRKFLDFHSIDLAWFPDSQSFRGTLREDLSTDFPFGYGLQIGIQRYANFVFTHTVIRKPAADE
ncbi:MAG TPA: 4'-phosphopantetheinyl transferase superfamily protein, partial [Candidatus Acidoferrales bacterium]|nr:4'-phosphopantetheinyl transferase superfamily protein [Candidatus Acidoferrales bacterium]